MIHVHSRDVHVGYSVHSMSHLLSYAKMHTCNCSISDAPVVELEGSRLVEVTVEAVVLDVD